MFIEGHRAKIFALLRVGPGSADCALCPVDNGHFAFVIHDDESTPRVQDALPLHTLVWYSRRGTCLLARSVGPDETPGGKEERARRRLLLKPSTFRMICPGFWMQYDNGTASRFARVNGVDDRTRPSLTPCGQEKLDAAKLLMGPLAVGGQEDSAALHCEPSGPSSASNPSESVRNCADSGWGADVLRGATRLTHHLGRSAVASQGPRP